MIYNTDPDFTLCFQNTLIKWIPCFILWMIAPFWIFALCNKKSSPLKYSILTFIKFVKYFTDFEGLKD